MSFDMNLLYVDIMFLFPLGNLFLSIKSVLVQNFEIIFCSIDLVIYDVKKRFSYFIFTHNYLLTPRFIICKFMIRKKPNSAMN